VTLAHPGTKFADANNMIRKVALALGMMLFASSAVAQDWAGLLKMVERDLRSENYRHARKWSIKLINSMSDHLGTGTNANFTMATTVAYRAMAEAGLGKEDEADWYWHVATAMYPKLAEKDWSVLGTIGQWPSKYSAHVKPSDDGATAVAVRRHEPKCPLSAIQGAYYRPIRVGAVIDAEGNARCPSLVEPTEAPTLAYAAFEALKRWQFEKTQPARYEVTVNFNPPHP
jgi:hypothetical protein